MLKNSEKYLISVIIPVYNVADYLHRCITSVLNQSYRNLEIILVDDGSTDFSGNICDEFAKKDSRIVVIHKKNGGLSSARNAGLDICKGDYIGFVDSDDFIHERMYELLLADLLTNNVLLAFCQTNKCINDIPEINLVNHTERKSSEEIIQISLRKQIWWASYTKLYHKSLFCGIRYPEGKNNEDYPVTIVIYDRCTYIAVNYNSLYNYCIRPNSICTSSFNPHKLDQVDTAIMVLNYMKLNHPGKWVMMAENILLSAVLGVFYDVIQANTSYYNEKAKFMQGLVRQMMLSTLINPYIIWKGKILLFAISLHAKFYVFLINILYRKQ